VASAFSLAPGPEIWYNNHARARETCKTRSRGLIIGINSRRPRNLPGPGSSRLGPDL